ncbi:LysR family transcriptional regulator [Mycobacterium yunnanensis]|uniref:LysR family transcriptional regulator n=1 Tax=Mycobacterium yunnanensis TaxID=368477 RepID=A0A9X3C1Z7_9MYCO|nr:LysR family transcriptional regulator [Mycobacterium yunnanensis]MCV7421823.1 LysR family transcriptional regulator [Mycobacterium yunnanensis]
MDPARSKLDIRFFVTLDAVARTGSLSAAAKSLGYTQSAVSQQISRLEALVGQRILNRSAGSRTATPTPAGRVLLRHAESLRATLELAAADIDALSRGLTGILRVGCYESVGGALLPAVLDGFTREFPDVRVALTEVADDGELLEQVNGNNLDLTFVVFPLVEGRFASRALARDPYVLVVREDSEIGGVAGPVSLDDHPDLSLITYGPLRSAHSMEDRLGRPGYRGQITFRSNHNTTLLRLAAQGYAAAVLPAMALDDGRAGIVARPLDRVSPRIVGIAWHEDRPLSAAAAGFIRAAEKAAGEWETRTGASFSAG